MHPGSFLLVVGICLNRIVVNTNLKEGSILITASVMVWNMFNSREER